jgi:hypothetical protein
MHLLPVFYIYQQKTVGKIEHARDNTVPYWYRYLHKMGLSNLYCATDVPGRLAGKTEACVSLYIVVCYKKHKAFIVGGEKKPIAAFCNADNFLMIAKCHAFFDQLFGFLYLKCLHLAK